MKINIYQIAKNDTDEYSPIILNFIKMSSKYAKVELYNLFNNQISRAQISGKKEAQQSYTKVFVPKLNGFNVALDVLGKQVNSMTFSQLLENRITINFFIGGAFGFESSFLSKCDYIVSLSSLTYAHKIANIVLLEQIFRGLCISNGHPYHKK
ncbi:LSU m3Psi1915 methyltransferase RlmH [hydrothermal vent metagenome]|uniref:LSU m3Psi1915 methyltransferase RlmH n=1 Tax=hydrothermal vent metagenome TaxID=652676 RepID=A0A3B1E1S5_9ZZZZ